LILYFLWTDKTPHQNAAKFTISTHTKVKQKFSVERDATYTPNPQTLAPPLTGNVICII